MNKSTFRIRENRAVFDIKKTMTVIACLLLFASCSTTSELYVLGNTNKTSVYINRKVSHISIEKYTNQQQEWKESVHKK